MFYKLYKDENGNVRDANGVRYELIECDSVGTPRGQNVGYTQFPTRADALAHYGVTEIPEAELFPQAESES